MVYVGVDGAAAGLLVAADAIKPTTQTAIDSLRASGIEIVMLTGDDARSAKAVAARLGIDAVLADVLPQDKAAAVKGSESAAPN